MCVDHKIICECGRAAASINLKDEMMPPEVVKALYCPVCSGSVALDSGTMLTDNGWVIDYDMEIAAFAAAKLPRNVRLTPEYIFDGGWCTWKGVYPGDVEESAKEKKQLLEMCGQDKLRYVREFRRWTMDRMERLSKSGWRKANEGKHVC